MTAPDPPECSGFEFTAFTRDPSVNLSVQKPKKEKKQGNSIDPNKQQRHTNCGKDLYVSLKPSPPRRQSSSTAAETSVSSDEYETQVFESGITKLPQRTFMSFNVESEMSPISSSVSKCTSHDPPEERTEKVEVGCSKEKIFPQLVTDEGLDGRYEYEQQSRLVERGAIVPYEGTKKEESNVDQALVNYRKKSSRGNRDRSGSTGDGGIVRRKSGRKERGESCTKLTLYENAQRSLSKIEDKRRGFDHCFVSIPYKERLSVLFATLRRNDERKTIVICNSWESAKYHALLFRQLELLSVFEMHESMPNGDMMRAYNDFLYCYPGILFASEIAMREFDIPPNVDYLVQYEPPMNPTEYIHRMNNASTYKTSCHKALLFVDNGGGGGGEDEEKSRESSSRCEKMGFLRYFNDAGVDISELQPRRVSQFQGKMEKLIAKHEDLNEMAWIAFRAFLKAYEKHPYNDVYDARHLDVSGVKRSFGQPSFASSPALAKVALAGRRERSKPTEERRSSRRSRTWSPKPRRSRTWSPKRDRGNSSSKKFERKWSMSSNNFTGDKHKSSTDCKELERKGSNSGNNWMGDNQKTWRKGLNGSGGNWLKKEKTWKHCHSHLDTYVAL